MKESGRRLGIFLLFLFFAVFTIAVFAILFFFVESK
jgi:hypothetical protein